MSDSSVATFPSVPASPFRQNAAGASNAALTICARNYFAQARVLAASVARHHPELDLHVVVVDEKDAVFATEHAELNLVWVEDLGVPGFAGAATRFDILELSTNVKAHALLRLLESYERVIYLDPDIEVYHRLDDVYTALQSAPIVVTPAAMTPVLDGHQPDDLEFLRVGAYNLGFIGVRDCAVGRAFLEWWSSRCLSDGFHETPAGVFLDQKWIDLVPVFFPEARILRDPGLNMASWNLHERRLTSTDRGFLVNEISTLKFFHFSGFDPHHPQQIAKRQTRFSPCDRVDLQPLLCDYAERLLAAHYDEYSQQRYSYDYFRSGEYLSPALRRIYANPGYRFALGEDPRASGSTLHRFGRAKGLVSATMRPAARATAGDLKTYQREVKWISRIFALILRMMGPNRYFLLMRYLAQAASIRRQPPM